MKTRAILLGILCLPGLLGGCVSIGPRQLRADQVDYARALGDAKRREILATIVGLRYADSPAFLNVTQIIAAYTFDATAGSTLNSRPDPGRSVAQATGTVSYSNHPTFTFTPTTGEAFANAYIRPLSPTLVLPLADSGIPIDLLLRITVQSIGGQQNGTMLGGSNGNGSPGFFELLQALRRLQLAGELTIEYKEVGRIYMNIGAPNGPEPGEAADDLARVRRLIGTGGPSNAYEIVYGQQKAEAGKIPMVTRSVLAILSDLGAEIPVPEAEIERGATKPTVTLVGGETRPTIIVHVGRKAPPTAYVGVAYGPFEYWIDGSDFDSKYAFTVVQNLMALAEVSIDPKAPIVTIPAN